MLAWDRCVFFLRSWRTTRLVQLQLREKQPSSWSKKPDPSPPLPPPTLLLPPEGLSGCSPLQSPSPVATTSEELWTTGLSVCFSISLLKIPLAAEIRVGAACYLTPPIRFSPASVSLLLMNINTPSQGEPLISGLIKPPRSDWLWLDRLCSLESFCSPHVHVRRRRCSTLWSITIGSHLGEGKWAGHWHARAVRTDKSA